MFYVTSIRNYGLRESILLTYREILDDEGICEVEIGLCYVELM